MSNHLTPLNVCFALFGGRTEVEEIAGGRPKGSYAWEKPSLWREAGDLPPHIQRKMLTHARRKKINLQPVWLIEGVSRVEIDAFFENTANPVAAE